MKTLNRILFVAIFTFALTSCSDNGPVSVDDKDARTVQSTVTTNNLDITASTTEWDGDIVWDGQGTDSDRCDKVGEGPRTVAGWLHFVLTGNNANVTEAILELGGTGSGIYLPEEELPTNGALQFYTPFFDLDGLTAVVKYVGSAPGQLVLSDYCQGRSLEVEKTAFTSYIRTHDWSIDKTVDVTNIWLYTDGTGNEKATWTIDVTYEDFVDGDWNVFGEITIENKGTDTKTITSIVDVFGDKTIEVDCGIDFELPYNLPAGETLTCTYSENLDSAIEGDNIVSVTVVGEEDPYIASAPVEWGDPDVEINETVQVKDISDLFGNIELGTVTAPMGDQFTYDKVFEFADFDENEECGAFAYDNRAQLIGDDDAILDFDDATLKVNVQCFVYETAFAKDDTGVCFIPDFSRWGWTNPINPQEEPYSMELWAGAAQCDTNNGEFVGYFNVTYNSDEFDYEFVIEEGFSKKEEHVYAGTTRYPQQARGRNTVDTVAPGQYYITPGLTGKIFVIGHAVVGLPDPNFGPEID